jgi:hypothetical protein
MMIFAKINDNLTIIYYYYYYYFRALHPTPLTEISSSEFAILISMLLMLRLFRRKMISGK